MEKKQELMSQQTAGIENRRYKRYSSMALVRINEFEGEALLKDISIHGFCLESRTYVDLTPKEHYTIQIIPETDTGIASFTLAVELRWIHRARGLFLAGFALDSHSMDGSMQQYIDRLKAREHSGS
ncbi:MAG: PilZ domain-containing protein [Treponema sp.]|jgi:hypothetical protein|nr:PilZ domain-containing protein [Treponema sp.]